jgi:hypothetical protein
VARLPSAIAFAAASMVLAVSPLASAQEQSSPARGLGNPTGERGPEDTERVDIPEPPGSRAAVEGEVRYPVPSPLDAARAAEEAEEGEPRIRIRSDVTTRLRALDANLQALAARGGGNVVNAVLSLLTGGLSITLGALRPRNDDEMAIYLYVYGGTAAVRGILDFVLTPNAQGAAITYQHMPMTRPGEVEERLAYGERALGGLAEQSLIARILDASLNLAAGVAVVPVLAANGFAFAEPLDYFVLIGAGVSIVSGIITLASTSAAEQRWGAYQELRRRLEEEREEERRDRPAQESEARMLREGTREIDVRFALSPTPTGGFGSFGLVF